MSGTPISQTGSQPGPGSGLATGTAPNLARAWQRLPHDPAAAEAIAAAALKARPSLPEAALLLGAARRRQGNLAGAHEVLARLAASLPSDAAAQFEWGMLLAAMGAEQPAIKALRHAAGLQPGTRAPWRALGDLLVLEGDLPEAGLAYAQELRAAASGTPFAEAGAALGDGRFAAAETILKHHVQQGGEDPLALWLLAEAAIRVGRTREAEAVLAHCLDQMPGFADARHSLVILLYAQGKWAQATPHITLLLQQEPRDASLRKLLTAALTRFGQFAQAIPVYESLLRDCREQPKLWLLYGHALKTVGRGADAERAYRTCIALAPGAAQAYLSLADVKTATFSAADIAAMRAALARPGESDDEKSCMHYALGHALEQNGDYAASFGHYNSGAELRRRTIEYSADANSDATARLISLYTPAFFAQRAGAGCPDASPIFVLGLPRSGSTLVEQILSSHSAVEGLMELTELSDIVDELRHNMAAGSYPESIAKLPPATLQRLGESYLSRAQAYRHQGRPFFIDKMPENFVHAGLIHLILPRARIIDVRRAPMPAGFAIFKQYFQAGRGYAYELGEIGRYYLDYAALMAHFDSVLPGRIHRVHYEELVSDTETQIRALLAYCDLPFEAACLRFWETARAVQTPSAQQVRQPVYRTGLDHWRHFEPFLAPLRAALKL